jgi:hypothetical protein
MNDWQEIVLIIACVLSVISYVGYFVLLYRIEKLEQRKSVPLKICERGK